MSLIVLRAMRSLLSPFPAPCSRPSFSAPCSRPLLLQRTPHSERDAVRVVSVHWL